jgi:hypothetical protein
MRKALMIVGAVIAVAALAAAAVMMYAARNLDSIIAERRPYLLQKLSNALDRKVEVSSVKVSLRWGLIAQLQGVKIEDDPALSDQPFVEAASIDMNVELLPLLSRKVHVTEVTLKSPMIHVIRTEEGEFNLSTIGKKKRDESEEKPAESPPGEKIEGAPITSEQAGATAAPGRHREDLHTIYVKDLVVDDAVIVYEERGANHQSLTISDVDLTVKGFTFVRAFEVSLKLAMLSDKQNVDITGTVGPLMHEGSLSAKNAPLAIDAKIDALDLARLRAIGSIGKAIPDALSIPDPVSIAASVKGTPSLLEFHLDSDLTGDRVAWAESFDKPASVPLKLSADGARTDSGVEIVQAKVDLADLEANLSDVKVIGGVARARIDTNRFDIAAMAKLIPPLQKYDASGHAEIHTDVQVADKQPRAKGTVSLAGVALSRPGDSKNLVSDLSGDIKVNGDAADAGPLKFNLGSGHATATLHARSLQPLSADYALNVDAIKVSEFAPKRPDDEHLNNLAVSGTLSQTPELALSIKAASSDGNLANVVYKDLNASGTMRGKELQLESFKVAAFAGDIAASGNATLSEKLKFALNLTATNVDIQSALQSQQSKSADMVQGILDAQLQVSGEGLKLDDIKPTLSGNGRATARNAKLIGINLAAEGLKKTKGLPGIGELVPASVVQRHQELFDSPDTDISSAGLSFVLQGPRITTHDLVIQTPDYSMTGDGWFDMEKNIEMAAHVMLTQQLTREIIAEKRNVVYLTNKDNEVDIPMLVNGKLPKPVVAPDIGELAERAGNQLLQQQGRNLGKLLKKGKKLNLPFLSNNDPNAPGGGNSNSSDNPLDQLKGLFH